MEWGTRKGSEGGVRGDGGPTHQVRIGPVALQGCGDFANNQVIHLLSGFWIVSGEAKKQSYYSSLVVSIPFPLAVQRQGSQCLGLPGLSRGKTAVLTYKTLVCDKKHVSQVPFLGELTEEEQHQHSRFSPPSMSPQLQGPQL